MNNNETIQLLKKARNLLNFQNSMGITEIRLTPEIEKFLRPPIKESPSTRTNSIRQEAPKKTIQSTSLFSPAPESALNQPLAEIYQDIDGCTKCPLHKNRKQIIPGCGPAKAKLFIVEDQPTGYEDDSGHPFAGESGVLFDKMMKAIGLERQDLYLTSIIKCRPESDKAPKPNEIRTCLTYLARQIATVTPTVICTMGPLAARILTGNNQSLFRFRGKFHDFHGTPLLPTFHPRFLLSNPEMKKGSWADLQLIQKKIN